MTIKNYLLLLVSLLSINSIVLAQTDSIIETKTETLDAIKIKSGAVLFQTKAANPTKARVIFIVKAGSVYDPEKQGGVSNLLRNLVVNQVRKEVSKIPANSITMSSEVHFEYTKYVFEANADKGNDILQIIKDDICLSHFDSTTIEQQKQVCLNQLEEQKSKPEYEFQKQLWQHLWGRDFVKLYTYGTEESIKDLTAADVNLYKDKYYVSNNSFFILNSKEEFKSLADRFSTRFQQWVPLEFSPELITKIIDFKPFVISKQYIGQTDGADGHFEFYYQLPGIRNENKASYCAYLLEVILNMENNGLNTYLRDSLHTKSFRAEYIPDNHSAAFKMEFKPEQNSMQKVYAYLIERFKKIGSKGLINEVSVDNAKTVFLNNYLNQKKNNPELFYENVVKFWNINDEGYYRTLRDSILTIKTDDMKRFVKEYFANHSYAAGLYVDGKDRANLKTDEYFNNADDSIKDFKFTYKRNAYELEGEENKIKLSKLLQWMTINPDLHVQVNGMSDKTEYSKTYDKDVFAFMDSIPTFAKTMPDKTKKKTIPLETMRSIKIVKFLYDNGIGEDRITGTSMPFKTLEGEKEEDNMVCTLTIENMRLRKSLYEFHHPKVVLEE